MILKGDSSESLSRSSFQDKRNIFSHIIMLKKFHKENAMKIKCI